MELDYIKYIKTNFPKIVYNSQLNYNGKKSIGFIISDNKVMVGYIDNTGELRKLIEPIDLSQLNYTQYTELINRIPTVQGFDEHDKEKLLLLLQNVHPDSLEEKNKILKELINSKKEKQQYNVIIDPQNDMILIKKEYDTVINDIRNDYIKQIEEYKEKLNNVIVEQNECSNKLIREKNQIIDSIKGFVLQVKDYIIKQTTDNNINTSKELSILHNKLSNEKIEIENRMNKLLDIEKEKTTQDQDKINELTKAISLIHIELTLLKESLTKTEIDKIVTEKFKNNCIKKIIEEKDIIINNIRDYKEKWLQWSNDNVFKNKQELNEIKNNIKNELQIIYGNLQKTFKHKNEYIDNLEISLKEKNVLLTQFKSNISDIKGELNNIVNIQITELTKKNIELEKELYECKKTTDNCKEELKKEHENVRIIKLELEKVKNMLEKNLITNNLLVQKDTNYTNCKELYLKAANINNMFYRKLEIITILDSIILNEEKNVIFSNLSNEIKSNIKTMYCGSCDGKGEGGVRGNIKNHKIMLNLDSIMKNKNIKTPELDSILCEQLHIVINYWDANVDTFKEQDKILSNIYEDITGIIKIFVSINPGPEKIIIQESNTKLSIECDTKRIYSNFSGIITDTQNESIFKQVEDGYSIVVFEFSGLTSTLKSLHYLTELPVVNIKIKNVFEQKPNEKIEGVSGTIVNLVNTLLPFKNTEFNFVKNESLDLNILLDDIKIDEIGDLIKKINTFRRAVSHLYIILEITFSTGKIGYITIVDLGNYPSNSGKDKNDIYFNEAINHLIYFMNKKLRIQKTIELQKTVSIMNAYSAEKYYINPENEYDKIESENNCLTIPILKYLDTLSNRKSKYDDDYHPTKFITIINIVQERKECAKNIALLDFSQKLI